MNNTIMDVNSDILDRQMSQEEKYRNDLLHKNSPNGTQQTLSSP